MTAIKPSTPSGSQPAVLSSLPNVSLEYLHDGVTTSIATGHLQLTSVDSRSGPCLLLSLTTSSEDPEPLFELLVRSTSTILVLPPLSYIIPSRHSDGESSDAKVDEEETGFIQISLSPDTPTRDRDALTSLLLSFTSTPPLYTPETEELPELKEYKSQLVLLDEERGAVIGSLSEDISIVESSLPPSSEPVVVSLDTGSTFTITPYSTWIPVPNPSGSKIIAISEFVSRGIVVGAEVVGRGMELAAVTFVKGTQATEKPLVFSDGTKKNVEGTYNMASGARVVSGQVIGAIGNVSAKVGGVAGRALGIQATSKGTPVGIKGIVHKSLIAFNVVTDSLETAGKALIDAGTNSTSSVIGHKLGPDAANMSRKIGGSVKHVALVYVDARGVTRRALLKSVGQGAVHAKMADGREVILSGDGNTLAQDQETVKRKEA